MFTKHWHLMMYHRNNFFKENIHGSFKYYLRLTISIESFSIEEGLDNLFLRILLVSLGGGLIFIVSISKSAVITGTLVLSK